MSTIIIYHKVNNEIDCPDGIASAWVAHKALSHLNPVILGCIHGEAPPDVSKFDNIFIVDFSFSKETLATWKSDGKAITLIDHHITAFKELQNFSLNAKLFDMNECGATLTFKTFFPQERIPVFLEYIRDRDLWNHKLEATEEVHAAMSFLGRTFELFDRLAKFDKDELLAYLVPIGTEQLAPKRAAISKALERVEWGNVANYPDIPFVQVRENEQKLISDICSGIYKQYPNALFVACSANNKKFWSLRSDKHGNNTDVGSIAKSMGGGGHHNAAGFEIKD